MKKSSLFLKWFHGYVRLLFFSMILMSFMRLIWFFSFGRGDEITLYTSDFFKALFLGARFDLSAFCYLSIIPFLLWLFWLLAGPQRWFSQFLALQRSLWLFLLLLLTLILLGDFVFYSFFQDHINVLIFGLIQDDTIAILKTIWKNYPVPLMVVGFGILYWCYKKGLQKIWPSNFYSEHGNLKDLPHNNASKKGSLLRVVQISILFLSLGLGARGSLGLFPLEIMHTAISANSFINTLCFNGVHALAHALQLYEQQRQSWNENLNQLGYRGKDQEALRDYSLTSGKPAFELNNLTSPRQAPLVSSTTGLFRPHVVMVLMESWGSDWMTHESDHFKLLGSFEKHLKADLFTPYLMPSNVATIGSLGSLVVDLPHRFYSPFLTESAFLNVPFSTAPAKIFEQLGYQTHFIYGGNLGWRNIDKFLPKQGFQTLHGESQIKSLFEGTPEEQISHEWGVFDEYVFKYAQKILEKSTSPQFLFILTTSNHPPYSLPSNYKALPLELTAEEEKNLVGGTQLIHDRLKVYQYANQQLGFFMNQIKESSLADNTVVAATGDHSFYIKPYQNLEFFQKWSVPLYLYFPKVLRPNPEYQLTIGNHIDIFPTLFHHLFSKIEFSSLGQDLLDPKLKPWAFHAPSWSAFEENIGIIITSNGKIINALCKEPNQNYNPCMQTAQHEQLRLRLVSMMGASDLIFENERLSSSQSQISQPIKQIHDFTKGKNDSQRK